MKQRSSPKNRDHLPFSWERWQQLQEQVDGYLSLPDVQRALHDNEFRLGTFQKPWKKAPTTLNVPEIARRYDQQKITDLATLANILRAMANQTQKLLAERNAPSGMREMTQVQEWMNLLLEGKTLRGSYDVKEVVFPDPVQTIEGLRIHAIMALEVILRVTEGDLNPEGEDTIVTVTNGLHVTANGQSGIRLPRTNIVGTQEEIWKGYSYGNPERSTTLNRIQGADFRLRQMWEYGNEHMQRAAKDIGWKKPSIPLSSTVIGSEVCTESAIRSGMRPTFFEGQWGIGLQAPQGESINFSRGHIRQQIGRAMPHITATVLHYPLDHPLVGK